MKRCTKTMSGRHIWDAENRGVAVWHRKNFPEDYKVPYPKCIACGLIDDRPPKRKGKI